jgi:hypothetical protein
MTVNYDSLSKYCEDPAKEIESLKQGFSQVISLSGSTSYRPRLGLFDKDQQRIIALASRPYSGLSDFKSSIAEMMYSYCAFEAKSCILVIDSIVTDSNGNKDCLNLYFMSYDYCHVVQLMYTMENETVIWDESDVRCESIDLKDHAHISQDMIELLYIYIHIDESPFKPHELLSYYTSVGHQFREFKKLGVSYVDFQ